MGVSSLRTLLTTNFPVNSSETAPSLERLLMPPTVPTVGEEGFKDVLDKVTSAVGAKLGDIKRNFVEGKKPNLKPFFSTSLQQVVRDAARLYYTNRNWLERRRFVDKPIKANKIADFLAFDAEGRVDIQALTEALELLNKTAAVYFDLVEKYRKALTPLSEQLRSNRLDRMMLSNALLTIRSTPHPTPQFWLYLSREFKFPLGDRYIRDGHPTKPLRNPARQLPPLSVDDVIALGQQVVLWIDQLVDNNQKLADLTTDKVMAFAADRTWHGWKDIEDMQYGNLKILKYMPEELDDENVNEYVKVAYGTLRRYSIDNEVAEDWGDVAMVFSGTHYHGLDPIHSIMYDVARALAVYIDRTIR